MKHLLARFRYFVATLLFLLTTAMSSGGAVFAGTIHKSYVCKYVGTPGVNETLQTGQNPIWVDNNSLAGKDADVNVGDTFSDAQGRSIVIVANTAKLDPEPGLDQCPPASKTNVTPVSVIILRECSTDSMPFTIPVDGNGVTYTHTYENGVLTVTATPDSTHTLQAGNGFTLNNDGTATYTHTFSDNDCPCICNQDEYVTATKPTFKDVCGLDHDKYTIPSKEGVYYTYAGDDTPLNPGNYYPDAVVTITIVAHAKNGYKLTGTTADNTWTKSFTNKPCVVNVRPPSVSSENPCGKQNDTFTIPSHDGVIYKIGDKVVPGGTYNAYANPYDTDGKIVVTAVPGEGFHLKGQKSWDLKFTDEECGGGGGEQNTPVTPGTVTFKEVCETANDTYTIPATPGVTYKVNGIVTAAGTYHATGTVTVTAEANVGYVLNGTATWTQTFTNEACAVSGGQVLGESFTLTPGKGAVAAAELANTGQNSLASAIVAFVIVTSSVLVYAFSPRRQLGNN